jgi:hypothetical protein
MIEIARSKAIGIDYRVGSCATLESVADGAVDVVSVILRCRRLRRHLKMDEIELMVGS